ncbi:MAG: TauD/TfdA dioxygenase family protein [Janthinobacterium lividum]
MSQLPSKSLKPAASDSLVVKQLELTIGAEVSGVDLRQPLTLELRDAIKALLLRHRVLFFRDQFISSEQQIALARQFGKIYIHPLTKQADRRVPAEEDVSASVDSHRISAAWERKHQASKSSWHADTSWLVHPAWGSLLRAIDIPPVGGDTIWANGNAVYESLPAETKEKIADLYVVHDFQRQLGRLKIDYPIVAHRLVKLHPETGEKILWINFDQKPSIIGRDRDASQDLVDELYKAYLQPEHHVRFKWSNGALAFWDNRAGLHYPVTNYGDYPREMERVLIEDFDAFPHYHDLP